MASRSAWVLVAVVLGLGGWPSIVAALSEGGQAGQPPGPAAERPMSPVAPGQPLRPSPQEGKTSPSQKPREVPPTERADPVPPEPDARSQEGPLATPLVCLILPLSGPHGALGDRVLDRIRTALVAAAMTRWEVRDDQGTERGVAEAAAWARERQCEVWVGGIGDREARAMVREARDQGVRLVGLWSRPIDQDDDRVIGVTPDRRAPMAILARYLEATGSRDVFLLAGPTAADRERAEVLQRSWSGSGKVVQVTALADPRASAAALVSAMTAERGDPGCQPQAVLLLGDPDLAVRWKGFLEAEGVLQSRGRCPAPLLAGPPSWAAPEALRRYGLALEGAVTVAWRDEEGSPEADPLALGARLAVAAVLHHVRGPRGSGWEGLEAALGEVTARYQAGRWQGVDPAPLRLEGGRALWVETRPDPDARDR